MRGEAEFNAFVSARLPALTRTAYLLTGDRHLAEDLVQSALFQAARHWERIEGHPEAYVRRSMYTQNVSWWRRRKVGESPLGQRDFPGVEMDPDLRPALEEALRLLTARQRTVLVLRYFDDLTVAQTSSALGISVGTVKSTTSEALAKLRALAPELSATLLPQGPGPHEH